ncbi:MAG: hypothetical protein HYV27_23750 [Candidatus Hydrogenedentes bacterium]|nr:hypothetical protein [Candidatus Hydrogenedentota bacterium]
MIIGWLLLAALAAPAAPEMAIDPETLAAWAAPYRNWHYYPNFVIPAKPAIPGHEAFYNTDVPTVYRVPGDAAWHMSFIAFDGKGYNSFVAKSDDLIHWRDYRLAMGFGPEGAFDRGGSVLGAYLYTDYDLWGARELKPRDGTFWSLYGAYPRQGGYELRPGYEGLAFSTDGLHWQRAQDTPILSVHDADCGAWERDCIYQPWLVEHDGQFYNFYNAAQGGREQTGLAISTDLRVWRRFEKNPVLRTREGGFDADFASDPKVFRDGDHWTMIYFGVGRGHAHIMAAFSRDLKTWTAHPEPLYQAGGHPKGLDKEHAHKISLVYEKASDTFYMYYCAANRAGRGIALLTSRPVRPDDRPYGK